MKNILFFGGGNIAQALISGLLLNGMSNKNIFPILEALQIDFYSFFDRSKKTLNFPSGTIFWATEMADRPSMKVSRLYLNFEGRALSMQEK